MLQSLFFGLQNRNRVRQTIVSYFDVRYKLNSFGSNQSNFTIPRSLLPALPERKSSKNQVLDKSATTVDHSICPTAQKVPINHWLGPPTSHVKLHLTRLATFFSRISPSLMTLHACNCFSFFVLRLCFSSECSFVFTPSLQPSS